MSTTPSEIKGTFFEVSFQTRPQKVIPISNQEQQALIGESETTVLNILDIVLDEDAETLRSIWIKSISERKRRAFRDLSGNETPEEQMMKIAALASDQLDLGFERARIENMDVAVPTAFSVDLPPTDPILRREALETLVPFQRIREILLQREENMSQEPLGQIQFAAHRIRTEPRYKWV